MAVLIGTTGSVTSWGANPSDTNSLITGGSAPSAFSLTQTADDFDITALGATNFRAATYGMRRWGGTITTRIEAATLGTAGFVTASGAYLTNLYAWTMNLTADALDTTPQTSGAAGLDRTFAPGLANWEGTWTARVDDTTVLVSPAAAYTAAVFRFIDDTTDHTLTGNINTLSLAASVTIGQLAEVTYNFKGNGALTAAGAGAYTRIFPTATVPRPVAGSLVLTAATNQTYTGDAFWTGIRLNCKVDELVTVEIDFQGTGALTIA